MKKIILSSLLIPLCFLVYSFIPFQSPEPNSINNVVVQFVATNGYGNDLYVDNFSVGLQFNNDIMIGGLTNIPKDTSFTTNGNVSTTLAPIAYVSNIGRNTASNFTVTMYVNSGAYTSTKTVTSLAPGNSTNVTFDNITINCSAVYNIKVYSNWASDDNKINDTAKQTTLLLPGTKRNVLFEAYTQWNCGPCASNTPYLDAFEEARWDTCVVTRYHVWWPGANNDPMYLANTTQINSRISLYGVNAVPTCVLDGTLQNVGDYSNLANQYNPRRAKGTPLSLTVVDTRIAPDTISAYITLNIISPLSAGNYKLRLNATERVRSYTGGTNGETSFKDIFRYMYPDINGISIPTTPGTYYFTIKYKRDASWIDSLMFNCVFVQNDNTKEVLNCAKSRHYSLDKFTKAPAGKFEYSKPLPMPTIPNSKSSFVKINSTDNIESGFNYEMFETGFPPAGWSIDNPDAGITWAQYSGVNGPTYGGLNSTYMNFYAYGTSGAVDKLTTKVYNNIDLTDTLKFDWAYAVYTGYSDRLQVLLSTNGGTTFPITLFDKAGSVLATAPATTSEFIPSGASQWGSFKVRIGDVITGIQNISSEIPSKYLLNQNYPNPFNPVTSIKFDLPKDGNVTLKIYDVLGNLIYTLYDGYKPAGTYNASFDGTNLASGIYFYQLKTDNFTDTKKMMLTK